MAQRNAPCFVTNNYSQRYSVTGMLGCLNWETLESHRLRLQLKLLHKIFTCQGALKLSDNFCVIHIPKSL